MVPADAPGHPLGVPRTPPDRLVVGRVLRPHGIRGELSVQVLSDAPERFVPGAELGVGDPDGPRPPASAVVRAARLHQGRLLLSLEGVEDRDAADRLRGAWLSIPVAAARPLDPGEFWPHQLVGLAVVDRQGRERGRVADVVPGAAHDLLAVELPGGASALVPAVAALVTVELEAGRVLVDAVPGLLGDNPEGSGEPQGGAPVDREGSGEPQGGAPVHRQEQAAVLVDIVTIFPGFFASPLATGLLGRAGERGLVEVRLHDLRDWATDRHRSVDDAPFGGGAGMVMRPGPWFDALDDLEAEGPARIVLLAPDGRRLDHQVAQRLAAEPRLVLCCGRYEGVDERVRTRVHQVLSIGDFVLAGGETAALVVLDAVARLVPGVMGNAASAADESFAAGLLEYPQYTRPAVYRGLEVPAVLRSGDHGAVEHWRREQALERTRRLRPDLLEGTGDAAGEQQG